MEKIDELIEAAWRDRRQGRLDDAERGLRAAIEGSRLADASRHLADALGKLAHVMRDRGRLDEALPLSEEAIRVSRGGDDPLMLAHAVRHLGDLHRGATRLADAERCYAEALAIYRGAAAQNSLDFANALRPAALLKETVGDRTAARQLFSEARDRYREAGVAAGVQECSRHLARLE